MLTSSTISARFCYTLRLSWDCRPCRTRPRGPTMGPVYTAYNFKCDITGTRNRSLCQLEWYDTVMKCDTRRRTKRLPSLRFFTPIRYDEFWQQITPCMTYSAEVPYKHDKPTMSNTFQCIISQLSMCRHHDCISWLSHVLRPSIIPGFNYLTKYNQY